MTEEKIQQLRDAGISEEVIIDMMKKPEEARSDGYIDPTTPSATFTQAQATGAPTQGPATSFSQTGTEIATLTPDILKYGGLAAGGYGVYKYGKGLANRVMNPPYTPPPGGSFNIPGQAGMPMPTQPVAPAMEPGGQRLVDFAKQQGQFQRPGIIQRGMDIATKMREAAAARVLPAIPNIARASALGIGLYPSSLNTGEAEQLAEYRRRTGQQP